MYTNVILGDIIATITFWSTLAQLFRGALLQIMKKNIFLVCIVWHNIVLDSWVLSAC